MMARISKLTFTKRENKTLTLTKNKFQEDEEKTIKEDSKGIQMVQNFHHSKSSNHFVFLSTGIISQLVVILPFFLIEFVKSKGQNLTVSLSSKVSLSFQGPREPNPSSI
jgi:hypothetical protein